MSCWRCEASASCFKHHKKLQQQETEKAQLLDLTHIFDKFEEVEKDNEDKFSERQDLVRIDECYHRFHLICLHRDWFMPRTPATDDFGDQIEYKLPELKRCPICRRECNQDEVQFVQKLADANPEFDDKGYLN